MSTHLLTACRSLRRLQGRIAALKEVRYIEQRRLDDLAQRAQERLIYAHNARSNTCSLAMRYKKTRETIAEAEQHVGTAQGTAELTSTKSKPNPWESD